ncbi:vWA domain-containing protein [Rhizobium mesoamericanum]|uniref:Putative transmembrane protein n=1 Tax=Rhizobium mesoamericanum STM3625 TaxID=1211777 RepID=K0PXB9_9HYPH|nr:VWA domain-containing protein [Rhizobium mesoamericanum]CCM74494.1 putative transmembrane protein [Rhizobium mesoamericanum STM3625]
MIADFHFLRPWWLLALLLPPVLVWMASRAGDVRDRWKRVIAPHLLDSLVIEPDGGNRLAPAWVLAVVLALAIVGVAGPTWRREPPPFVSDTASLVIAVDLSPTMDAKDISPSRIERVKLKIHDILAARKGARTAAVAYAGTAHLVVPLTDDADLIQSYTDALSTRLMPKPGKDTTEALRLAERLLQPDDGSGTVLLLTDGIESEALEGAKAVEGGLVVLGVGTPEGGAVEGGGVAKLDLAALKAFGSDARASVATITDDDADVRWIVQKVATNFKRQTASTGDRWRDVGWWLLIPVALFFVLSFRRGWVTRLAVVMLAFRLLVPEAARAGTFEDMWLTPDQQGRLAFERGDFDAAAAQFQDPMWKGTSLYKAGKFKEAAEAFALVDTAEAWFDKGNSSLHLGDFEEGVAAYQKALEKRRGWTEAEANLALAKRLLKEQQDNAEPDQPNLKPDSVQFDDKGKKGKAGTVDMAEETSEMWIKNIQATPADLMARKFAIEAEQEK